MHVIRGLVGQGALVDEAARAPDVSKAGGGGRVVETRVRLDNQRLIGGDKELAKAARGGHARGPEVVPVPA